MQIVAIFEIMIPKNSRKLISADPEDGTVRKHFADHGAGCFQINVALFMAIGIVDAFQIIAVKEANRKFQRRFPVVDLLLNFLNEEIKSAFVPNRG